MWGRALHSCVQMPREAEKRVSDPLELELQVASHQTWVLGTKLRPCARAVSAPNLQAISPPPSHLIFVISEDLENPKLLNASL